MSSASSRAFEMSLRRQVRAALDCAPVDRVSGRVRASAFGHWTPGSRQV